MNRNGYFCIDQLGQAPHWHTTKPASRIRRSRAHRRQEGDPLYGSQAHHARSSIACNKPGRINDSAPPRLGHTHMWAR